MIEQGFNIIEEFEEDDMDVPIDYVKSLLK